MNNSNYIIFFLIFLIILEVNSLIIETPRSRDLIFITIWSECRSCNTKNFLRWI